MSYAEYKKNKRDIKISLDLSLIEFNDKSRVVIIVPFRDLTKDRLRTKQLETFIKYYHKYIPNIEVVIVEQSKDNKKFNRGKLLNIGFDLTKNSEADAFIFHDVDLISPESVMSLYTTIPEMPIHIANLWTEKYAHKDFLGGIISFKKEDFEKINGFPNNFWGWGGEDDSVYNRLSASEIPVLKPFSEKISDKIIGLEHPSEADNLKTRNLEKKKNILSDLTNWKQNGLNDLNYKILKTYQYKYPNVQRVLVKI